MNEDCIDIDLINKLLIVADGIGGAGIGDRVSNEIKDNEKKFFTKVGGDPDSTLPFFYSPKYLLEANALINSLHYANNLIIEENLKKSMNDRGASSILSACYADNILTFAGAGNLKAYLFRDGKVSCIVQPDILNKTSSRESAKFYSFPVNGVGLFDQLHLNISENSVKKGDKYLLVSDGVFTYLDNHELQYILDKEDKENRKLLDEIFELANIRGNKDN